MSNPFQECTKCDLPCSSLSTVADNLALCSSFILSRWFRRCSSPPFSSNWFSRRWMRSSALPCFSCTCGERDFWDDMRIGVEKDKWESYNNNALKNMYCHTQVLGYSLSVVVVVALKNTANDQMCLCMCECMCIIKCIFTCVLAWQYFSALISVWMKAVCFIGIYFSTN